MRANIGIIEEVIEMTIQEEKIGSIMRYLEWINENDHPPQYHCQIMHIIYGNRKISEGLKLHTEEYLKYASQRIKNNDINNARVFVRWLLRNVNEEQNF